MEVDHGHLVSAHIACPNAPKVHQGTLTFGQHQTRPDSRCSDLQVQSMLGPGGGGVNASINAGWEGGGTHR